MSAPVSAEIRVDIDPDHRDLLVETVEVVAESGRSRGQQRFRLAAPLAIAPGLALGDSVRATLRGGRPVISEVVGRSGNANLTVHPGDGHIEAAVRFATRRAAAFRLASGRDDTASAPFISLAVHESDLEALVVELDREVESRQPRLTAWALTCPPGAHMGPVDEVMKTYATTPPVWPPPTASRRDRGC